MKKRVTPIKRSVALHPQLDLVVREAYSSLVSLGHRGITYSAALNLLLLAAFVETQPKTPSNRGWSQETRRAVADFLRDRRTVSTVVSDSTMLPYLTFVGIFQARPAETSEA